MQDCLAPTASKTQRIELRIYGHDSLPTLIYLPGLHGNWTLIGRFRKALADRVHFIEVSYPPTLDWSLEDHAAALETELAERGIARGWLLAESFSSQVAWPLLARNQFELEGLILAGGFVRHPLRCEVRLAERLCGDISLSLLTRLLFGYAILARWRFRNSPETQQGIEEFIARLTENERRAARHRLRLILESDPCLIAQKASLPIFALTGSLDPVVPWLWVRRWLRKNCTSLRDYRIIWHADHNVLGTGAEAAAEQVIKWIKGVKKL